MKQESAQAKPKKSMNFLLVGSGQVFTSNVLAGFLVGYLADYLLGTMPIFMMLCGLLGFVGGSLKVHRMMSRMEQTAAENVAKPADKVSDAK